LADPHPSLTAITPAGARGATGDPHPLWSLDQVENARVLLAELGVERGG